MNCRTIFFGFIFSLIGIATHAQSLTVMSYNIKLDYPKEGENSWQNRKDFMFSQIQFYAPDFMGVQEAMYNQMQYLNSVLIDYAYIGVGRDDGKNEGEFSAIFYRKNQFEVIEQNTFWLSETPKKVSKGWDAVCNRVCTYGLFQDKKSKEKFYVFNTHFDHVGKEARAESAKLILNKIKTINTENYPVILMGDFNLEEQEKPIQLLKESLQDAFDIAAQKFGGEGTFNGFDYHKMAQRRIDYVFVNKAIKVNQYAVLNESYRLKYPSDHFPVFVELEIKKETR